MRPTVVRSHFRILAKDFGLKKMPVVVSAKVDWGAEIISEIWQELQRHVEIVLREPGCDDFLFAVDVNNPEAVMGQHPPRSIDVTIYQATEIPRALD